jgi:hypothetical protein
MDAVVTVVGALIVFVLTQSFLKLVLEPIQEQKKLIGDVAHALLFYANVYHPDSFGPPDERRREELDEARKTLRGLAGRLQASLWTVPFYDSLARLGRVPRKEDVLAASTQLVGWSNSLYGRSGEEGRDKRKKIIADSLGITKRLSTP